MIAVYLKQKRSKRLEHGHPWILLHEIDRMDGATRPGDLVKVFDHSRRFIGTGMINTHAQVMIRMISFDHIDRMDEAFFRARFEQCLKFRQRFVPDAHVYRFVHGEADFLPGLIVDRFDDYFVVRLLSVGMEIRRKAIVQALVKLFHPAGIYEASDANERELEGLRPRSGVLYGQVPPGLELNHGEMAIRIDVRDPEQVDLFLRQRENLQLLAPLMKQACVVHAASQNGWFQEEPLAYAGESVPLSVAEGANVLDCYANYGYFALHALKYGARKVTCLDVSDERIEHAKQNMARNGFHERAAWVKQDGADFLRKQVQMNKEYIEQLHSKNSSKRTNGDKVFRLWDVVILNPPAFAKSQKELKHALRSYKDLNLHAMKLVVDGGFLITSCSSRHVGFDQFLNMLEAAAADAGKLLRMVNYRGAGEDYPHLIGVNIGNELKFAVFEVRSRKSAASVLQQRKKEEAYK